jgi:hypothetical protein
MIEIDHVSEPFPLVIGNEEETGMMVHQDGYWDEPYDMVRSLGRYIPVEVTGSHSEFLINGFRLYPGRSGETEIPTNLERATPESVTPPELVVEINAGEVLLRKVVDNYAIEASADEGDVTVRVQRRTVDSFGNRKACHDNFAQPLISKNSGNLVIFDTLHPVMKTYLGTRMLINGAGNVSEYGGVDYAQKINGLAKIVGYGFFGSMVRMTPNAEGYRFEVRNNDINISDWATNTRIAGTGNLMALMETGQTGTLEKYADTTSNERDFIDSMIMLNCMELDDDGNLSITHDQRRAIDYQQHASELVLKKLGLYVDDIPASYYHAAQEIYDFCDDFVAVTSGREDIVLLADRADWAAKLVAMRASVERDRKFGIPRAYDDYTSAAIDEKYDWFEVHAINGKIVSSKDGLGYKLRNRGAFRDTVSTEDVARAYKSPPQNTRAKIRGELLSSHYVEPCDWDAMRIVDIIDRERYANVILPGRQTELPPQDVARVAAIRRFL